MQRTFPKLLSLCLVGVISLWMLREHRHPTGESSPTPRLRPSEAVHAGDEQEIEPAPTTLAPTPDGPLPTDAEGWEALLSSHSPSFDPGQLASVFDAVPGKRVELSQPVSAAGTVTMSHLHEDGTRSIGIALRDFPGAVAYFQREADGTVSGHLIRDGAPTALSLETRENGTLAVERRPLDRMICARPESGRLVVGLPAAPQEILAAISQPNSQNTSGIPLLQSHPGATKVIYLDFDGETVSGTSWNAHYTGGAPIVAQAFATPSAIREIWETVAEDYRPFQVNVTTDRTVFDSTASRNRCMVILTPTKAWYGNVGGIAYTGSFGHSVNQMCWVFNTGANAAAESASHEAGHQLGLHHDGSNSSVYYAGHTHSSGISWAPIMGLSYGKTLSQFSKGEYPQASETQDDLAVIAKTLPLRSDDHGDTVAAATLPADPAAGRIDLAGIIGNESDKDVFRIPVGSPGRITLVANPSSPRSNLDLELLLADASGTPLASSAPGNSLSASVSIANAAPGNYYLFVSGSALGTPANGYSKYGSLGGYRITGSFPATGETTAPTGFSASDGTSTSHVELVWNSAPYATGYKVYRASASALGSFSLVGETSTPSFRDTTGVSGTVYRYSVASHNPLGESTKSAADTGFRQDVPSIVASVTASDGTHSSHVQIKWGAATRASGYRIYRNTHAGSAGASEIGFVEQGTTFEDRSGFAGETYHYFVVAMNAAGSASPSASDPGSRTAALARPGAVVASQGEIEGAVLVRFENSAHSGTHSIFRSPSADPRDAIFLGRTSTGQFYDKTAAPGATYHYFIKAEDAGKDSALSPGGIGMAGAPTRGDDRYEPNDRIDEATPLDGLASTWLSTRAGQAIAMDDDWYSFAVPATAHRIEILLRQSGPGSVSLSLLDEHGIPLAKGSPVAGGQILVHEPAAAGRSYHLLVAPQGSGTATYNLLWRAVSAGQTLQRSDLSIGKTPVSQIGRFHYEAKARQQKVQHRLHGARSVRAFASAVNESVGTAPLSARSSKPSRFLSFKIIARGQGGARNITAAMKRRGYIRELAPLESTAFEFVAKPAKSASRANRAVSLDFSTSIGGELHAKDSSALTYRLRK